MIKVHVWLPYGEYVGHASLSVGEDYISFWPEEAAGKKDLKTKRRVPGSFKNSLMDDIICEGGRPPFTVELDNLDEGAVLDYIAALRSKIPTYQLARYNCSHVVAHALMAGSGEEPSFIPNAGAYGRVGRVLGRGIWTPHQVLRFAREVRAATEGASRVA